MANEQTEQGTRILILGAGFGGVFAAKTLAKLGRGKVAVELVNSVNYFVFNPLLPEVAGGSISTSDAASPLRELLPGVHVRKADVFDINCEAREVTVVQGTKRRPITLPYDHLVIGLGQKVDLSRIPGMTEHALTIKDLSDAVRLRSHVIDCLEHADVTRFPKLQKKLLTFVVVGGGFSGVETVGEMKELIDRSLRFYPNINPADIRVLLLEFADRILQELPESLALYAQKQLEKRGIEIACGLGTRSASGTSLELTDGTFIETKTIVATIGNGPNPIINKLGVELIGGKLPVDRTMRVKGLKNVWALGDAALIPLKDDARERGDFAPPTAQFAVREGACLGKNILAQTQGRDLKPFFYVSKGSMASLGGKRAVAEVGGMRLSGFLAWLLWRAFYLSFLPGVSARVRVMVNWILDMVLPRSIVQVQFKSQPATRYVHVRKGKRVFEEGMEADGFYVVVEGRFQVLYHDPKTGDDLEWLIGPGDHFGQRVILGEGLRTGTVVCLEDGLLLMLARQDFERFAVAFPVLRNYFADYIPKSCPKSRAQAEKEQTAEGD
ncbi:MAG: FAD-dependent oxidoreductase [Rhodospirillales bacterium]